MVITLKKRHLNNLRLYFKRMRKHSLKMKQIFYDVLFCMSTSEKISQKLNFYNDSPSYINIDDNIMQSKRDKEKRNRHCIFILVCLTKQTAFSFQSID